MPAGKASSLRGVTRWTAAVGRSLVTEWRDDRVTGLAAEIAFFGMLSFFPSILAVAAALGSLETLVGVEAAETARREVLDFLTTVLTDEADDTIEAVQQLFTERRPGLLTFGLLAALWAASRGFMAVIRALDAAYDLEERRSWLQTRITALGLALGSVAVGTLMLVMLAIGPLLGSGADVAAEFGFGEAFTTFWDWLRWPFAFAVLVCWTALVFHVAPFHHTPWRWDLPGALLTAVLWMGATVGLRLYLDYAQGSNPVFGTLGGALILILWLYLMAVGLLMGGELNGVLIHHHGVRQDPGRHWPMPRGRPRPGRRAATIRRRRA